MAAAFATCSPPTLFGFFSIEPPGLLYSLPFAGLTKVLPTWQGIYKLPAQRALTTSTGSKQDNEDDKSTHWLNKITQFTVNLNCFGFLLATPAKEISFLWLLLLLLQLNLIKLEQRQMEMEWEMGGRGGGT